MRHVPISFIHEPWLMTEMDKSFTDLKGDYPPPIVDITESGKKARSKLWGFRKNKEVKKDGLRIVKTHTRNNRSKRTKQSS